MQSASSRLRPCPRAGRKLARLLRPQQRWLGLGTWLSRWLSLSTPLLVQGPPPLRLPLLARAAAHEVLLLLLAPAQQALVVLAWVPPSP